MKNPFVVSSSQLSYLGGFPINQEKIKLLRDRINQGERYHAGRQLESLSLKDQKKYFCECSQTFYRKLKKLFNINCYLEDKEEAELIFMLESLITIKDFMRRKN